MAKKLIISILRGYKLVSVFWLSLPIPFASSTCKHYPTCGNYALMAVDKYGIRRGLVKSIFRILKCNPFNKSEVGFP